MSRTFNTYKLSSIPAPVGNDAAARAESIARNTQQSFKLLEANLAKSLLLCETLWELLRDEHGWTDHDLYKKLEEIDLRDGLLDNKNQRKAVTCPDCRRAVSPRHPACLYCGRVIDASPFTAG
ncbi:MAG: hypothetical protein IH624_17895 [Phycisphaerae bacterium]|nr:hypothetical protein [Phycisphaerae bacterium]